MYLSILTSFLKQNTDNHAIVPPAIWDQFAEVLNPGSLYRIRNIRVSPAAGLLRPVRTTNVIIFLFITIVDLEPENDFGKPFHKIDLISLVDLAHRLERSPVDEIHVYSSCNASKSSIHTATNLLLCLFFVASDVIGLVEHLDPIQTIDTKYCPK